MLDTGSEPLFDALPKAAALVTGAPIAPVRLVDADRQRFKSNIGLDGVDQTPREIAFCAHTIRGDALLEIPHATRDARFADNPLDRGTPDIRFYARGARGACRPFPAHPCAIWRGINGRVGDATSGNG